MMTIAGLTDQFPDVLTSGLTNAQVEQSRATYGRNVLTPLPHEPLWKKFLEKFDEPIIRILLSAALLSMIVDLFRLGHEGLGYTGSGIVTGAIVVAFVIAAALRKKEFIPLVFLASAIVLLITGVAVGHVLYEGLAVMVAVFLATGVSFFSEYKSDREFEILNSKKDALQVTVLRNGTVSTIPLEDLVVGDIVVLSVGDEIPADGRVVKATELLVDQSLMNGESEPAKKYHQAEDKEDAGPDVAGCLYRGTHVVNGLGHMLVTETGDATMFGQIARRLSADDSEQMSEENEAGRVAQRLTVSKELTPLQHKLKDLAGIISKVGYIAAVAIFAVLVIRGIMNGDLHLPAAGEDAVTVWLATAGTLLQYFLYMVIVIVVAVPEGLPMSVTVSLALAMRKMTRANSLVRQLVACETIGSATIICSDKTGTLTQNAMKVVRVGIDGRWSEEGREGFLVKHMDMNACETITPQQWIALNAAVNSTSYLEEKDGKLHTVGNSTEGSLLHWLLDSGTSYEELRLRCPVVAQFPFSSSLKRMTSIARCCGKLTVLTKGAPEWILVHSKSYLADNGQIVPWTDEVKEATRAMFHEAAKEAMRTLAFGFSVLPQDTTDDPDTLQGMRDAVEENIVYAGFVAIRDPLRPDVKEAIEECRSAGIKVQMITGDTLETARAIGKDIGLVDDEAIVMTSQEFNELTDDELKKKMPYLRILARAQPLDKLRMVKLHQQLGEVVAVTGDGTNDAPALKQADVGLSMGKAGTEVAKEASKIVLLDDSFSTIVKAVYWGRALYENIQRFIQFQLTINVSALGISLLAPLFGVRPPFTVLQFLWINVIMDTFAAIALCSEPPRKGLMLLPPKKRDESIVTKSMLTGIIATAAFYMVIMLGILVAMKGSPDNPGWLAGAGEWLRDDTGGIGVFTVRQATIFFTAYVLFQVWNLINCRSLVPEVSGLKNLFANRMFLLIASLIIVGQVIIVHTGGTIFQVEPLLPADWGWILLGTMSVLVFAEAVRQIRRLKT